MSKKRLRSDCSDTESAESGDNVCTIARPTG
jgi:hypothetical protein